MVSSVNHFAEWVKTYLEQGVPHKILRDELTGTTSLYSTRSRQIVAKTQCSRDELKAAGVTWPQ
jgi:hypothetical protein